MRIYANYRIIAAPSGGEPWLPEDAGSNLVFKNEMDDASKFSITGGQVQTVLDQTTYGNDAPRYSFTGGPVSAVYDDTNKRLECDGVCFQVNNSTDAFLAWFMIVEEPEGHYIENDLTLNADAVLTGSNGKNRLFYADTDGSNTFHGSTIGGTEISINGETIQTSVPATFTGYVPYPGTGLNCVYNTQSQQTNINIFNGGRTSGVRHISKCKYKCVLCYENPVAAADIDRVFGYLMHLYGIESKLPAGHPYKNAPPTK